MNGWSDGGLGQQRMVETAQYCVKDIKYTLSGAQLGSALAWHSERSRPTECSKSCDLQPAMHCAICGAQGVLPCVGWEV